MYFFKLKRKESIYLCSLTWKKKKILPGCLNCLIYLHSLCVWLKSWIIHSTCFFFLQVYGMFFFVLHVSSLKSYFHELNHIPFQWAPRKSVYLLSEKGKHTNKGAETLLALLTNYTGDMHALGLAEQNTCYKLRCGLPANLVEPFYKMESKKSWL